MNQYLILHLYRIDVKLIKLVEDKSEKDEKQKYDFSDYRFEPDFYSV